MSLDKQKVTRPPSGAPPGDYPGDASSHPNLQKFADALTTYVLDPMQWDPVLEELDRISSSLPSWDPRELLAQLSRAESLSWHIREESGQLTGSGFAYVLLDAQDRTTGCSDNLTQLIDYLYVDPKTRMLEFGTSAGRRSFESARKRLRSGNGAHLLVEFSRAHHPGHRFGYLIAEEDFPDSLRTIANGARTALFIAQPQPDERLRKVVQASFGLTDAEAQVTLSIARGLTLKQTASELGISVNTARNHLQATFAKSGINRQGDLVLVITQLSVILAATTSEETPSAARSVASIRPTPPQHFMILPDGRRIAYRTYGDPMGEPVVFFHESIGSSRLPPGTDADAKRRNLHLIAPERPGFGLSDGDPDCDYRSVCDDLQALLSHLRIQRATLIGNLSGGAFALSMAALKPALVRHVLLTAARPPGPMTGRFQHLMQVNKKLLGRPWLISTFFNILRNRASRENNGKLINAVYGANAQDRAFLQANPRLFDHMVTCTLESFSVSAAGVVNELRCFAAAPPPGSHSIRAPITAWHGTSDGIAEIADLQKYLQGCSVDWHPLEGAGSLLALSHWQELLDAARDTGSR
ncbi:MAG: alpha/beta fold hydrolase [Pseudomonadales bacterium]|nr:alpha/beta fold hydrolase [Pseudomonadales bacterium]